MADVEFEEWIRGQLEGPATSAPPAPPRPRRWPRFVTPGVQVAAGLLAAGGIVAGLASGGAVAPPRALVPLRAADALPANTWEGSPPPPVAAASPSPSQPAPAPVATRHAGSGAATPRPSEATPEPATSERGSEDGAGPSPTASATPAPTPTASQTFRLVGGSATVSCSGSHLSLVSVTPNPGFQAETDWKDENATVEIRFRSDTHDSQLDAWCSGGQVQSQVQEQSA